MSEKKSIVFLCNCGNNISDFMELDALSQWAANREDVLLVERHNLLCSPDGRKHFQEVLQEHDAERVIIGACSPKMHEKTFQTLAEELGINISTIHMANIREQCGWVTADKKDATEKAKELIRGAIQRSGLAEDLERRTMEVNTDVLIIGGGIAGIETALCLARAGRKTYIVERDIAIGGFIIKTEEVAPNMECSPCVLAPRLSEINDSKNIEVITNAEVKSVIGFFGNFTAAIHQKARAVEDSCIGCEACFEVCPVDVESRFHHGLGTHKAIHTLFPGSVPAAAAIDKNRCRHYTDGSCIACAEICPFGSVNFEQKDREREIQVGSVVIATGFDVIDPSSNPNLGYKTMEDVYTLSEFERIASSNGPYGGDIRMKNGRSPDRIAVIHCTDVMFEKNGSPSCTPLMNMIALKVGEYVHKKIPGAEVFNVHAGMVMAGPKETAYLNKIRDKHTRLIECTDMTTVTLKQDDRIVMQGAGLEPIEVDMVVLATSMKPSEGTAALAELLHLELDENGYILPDHELLHQTGSSLDGIYIAGCAVGPCNMGTAVTRGHAAAGDILSKLVPGRHIELEIMTSVIDEKVCIGCKMCISVCPYKAVNYDEQKHICQVNEVICRGCGTCTATCPSGASKARHFTDDQIYAEIGGILHE